MHSQTKRKHTPTRKAIYYIYIDIIVKRYIQTSLPISRMLIFKARLESLYNQKVRNRLTPNEILYLHVFTTESPDTKTLKNHNIWYLLLLSYYIYLYINEIYKQVLI